MTDRYWFVVRYLQNISMIQKTNSCYLIFSRSQQHSRTLRCISNPLISLIKEPGIRCKMQKIRRRKGNFQYIPHLSKVYIQHTLKLLKCNEVRINTSRSPAAPCSFRRVRGIPTIRLLGNHFRCWNETMALH